MTKVHGCRFQSRTTKITAKVTETPARGRFFFYGFCLAQSVTISIHHYSFFTGAVADKASLELLGDFTLTVGRERQFIELVDWNNEDPYRG